jgi:hypothetical protein
MCKGHPLAVMMRRKVPLLVSSNRPNAIYLGRVGRLTHKKFTRPFYGLGNFALAVEPGPQVESMHAQSRVPSGGDDDLNHRA